MLPKSEAANTIVNMCNIVYQSSVAVDKGLIKQQSELCGLSLHEKQMLVLYVGNFNLLVCERESYYLQSNY